VGRPAALHAGLVSHSGATATTVGGKSSPGYPEKLPRHSTGWISASP